MQASSGVGPAWRHLAEQAEAEIHRNGAHAEVKASISSAGTLMLTADQPRPETKRTLAEYVSRSFQTCEQCGGTARIGSGATLSFLCDNCRS
jgi:hypothetical protein